MVTGQGWEDKVFGQGPDLPEVQGEGSHRGSVSGTVKEFPVSRFETSFVSSVLVSSQF